MQRNRAARRWMLPLCGALALGCSLATGSLPAAYRREALDDLNAFQPPSPTPFLPVAATATLPDTATSAVPSPTATPMETLTILFTLTGTDTPTPTLTIVIYPSATPTQQNMPYLSPTITKTKPPAADPTKPPEPRVEIQVTATATPMPTVTPIPTATPTETPEPTGDPRSPTPTETLSGSETAAPTRTETPPPTDPPTPTPTPTVTRTPPPSATPTTAPTTTGCATFNFEWEAQVAVMLNEQRANYGKYPLVMNDKLTLSARAHSVDMVVNRFMSHTGSDGSTPQQREQRYGYYGRYWGEIIAGGTPTVAVTWWMNEPGHRDMVLGTNWPYVDYGVGYAYCPGQGWFTVDMGAP
jgi:uncharacterized protein YkwD